MPAPRGLADLPYADCLQPFHGRLGREGVHDTVHFDGNEFHDADGGRTRFTECAFSSVTVTGGRWRRVRFNDAWLHTVRWVGTDLAESDWLDTEVVCGVFAGTEVFGAEMRRVSFYDCKFDSVNVRAARLREISFTDCLLRDVDFGGAVLTDVAFPGSALEGVRFDKARMAEVDLRGAAGLGIAAGHGALRGAVVGNAQLLELAPALARELGIAVRDR